MIHPYLSCVGDHLGHITNCMEINQLWQQYMRKKRDMEDTKTSFCNFGPCRSVCQAEPSDPQKNQIQDN